MINRNPVEDVLAAILKYSFGKTLDESNYRKLSPLRSKKRGRTLVEEEGKTRLFIAKGKVDKTTKKKLVEFVVKKAGTPKELIENIEIRENFSFITVPFTEAEIILKKFRKIRVGKKSVVEKAKAKKQKK